MAWVIPADGSRGADECAKRSLTALGAIHFKHARHDISQAYIMTDPDADRQSNRFAPLRVRQRILASCFANGYKA
jgi:hypothetical protein